MCPKRAKCGENPVFGVKIGDFWGENRGFNKDCFGVWGFFVYFCKADYI